MAQSRIALIIILAFTLVVGVGYVITDYPLYWTTSMLADGAGWVIACSLVAILLRCWQREAAPLFYLLIIAIYLVGGIGVAESLSAIFFFSSVVATGYLVLELFKISTGNFKLEAGFAIGLAMYLAIWGVLAHFPINERWLYITLLALPIVLVWYRNFNQWGGIYSNTIKSFKIWGNTIPFPILVCAGCLIGWVGRFAFFPTVGYDDNAQHLRLWTELLYHYQYSFDVSTQVWEVEPFAVDLMHAVLSLVAGADARGALNFSFFLLLLSQFIAILNRFEMRKIDQSLLLLLLVSTPMFGVLLTSLQTELFLALLCTLGTRLVLECDDGWLGRNNIAVLAVAALCAATKLPGMVLGAFIVVAMVAKLCLLPTSSKGKRNSKSVLIIVGIFAFVALHSYVVAYILTGNPVFPLYNGIFKSAFFRLENFSDKRWIAGFSFLSYVREFFETSRFLEARDFTAGFQYLVLLPAALLAIVFRRTSSLIWVVIIPMLGFGMIMFHATQYWRYMFPVMPLACVVILVLFIRTNDGLLSSVWMGVLIGCMALNVYFFPGISWMLATPMQDIYTREGKDIFRTSIAGDLQLIHKLNISNPGSHVLFADRPYGAILNGSPIYINDYSPEKAARFLKIKTPSDVSSYIQNENVQFAILSLGDQSPPGSPNWLLREYLSDWGYPIMQEGAYVLYRSSLMRNHYENTFNLHEFLSLHEKKKGDTGFNGINYVHADGVPRLLAVIDTKKALIARYHVKYECSSAQGAFVAQLNWDKGSPYYRLVPCSKGEVDFTESIPIPLGAREAGLYITTRDAESAEVSDLSIDLM